jgi:RHH-type rel operon transcriptional repressor/antitoxin RelB
MPVIHLYIQGAIMAVITVRIDDELKSQAFDKLNELGILPSDLLRQTLQYVVEQGKSPFKTVIATDEDADLYDLVRKRINEPHLFMDTTLDDLFNKGSR